MSLDPIQLPKPEKGGGKSVLASLWARRTVREISPTKLPAQTLSNLLWAAGGVNRRRASFDRCGRTAGSASNSPKIDLYLVTPEGACLYQPRAGRTRTSVIPRCGSRTATSTPASPPGTSRSSQPRKGWRPGSTTAIGRVPPAPSGSGPISTFCSRSPWGGGDADDSRAPRLAAGRRDFVQEGIRW
jgi:hypothetical protein